MKHVATNLRGNLRLAVRRLRGGAPAQGGERTTLQRIAVAATVLCFSLVLPAVDTEWRLQAPDAVSIAADTGPAIGSGPNQDTAEDSARKTAKARSPRHRDLILGSSVRAAMSRMTASY